MMNQINYDHSRDLYNVSRAATALKCIFEDPLVGGLPASLLDVGCGPGTWLRAAMELQISDAYGVEGVDIPEDQRFVSSNQIMLHDLTKPWQIGRRFGLIICLEVAEHLCSSAAENLIQSLTEHSDTIAFSAAPPGQSGQHHVNCQWPTYWQNLFNQRGFTCDDSIRWRIWENADIDSWYRQNLFIAKHDPEHAGKEPRMCRVLHPEIVKTMLLEAAEPNLQQHLARIRSGYLPWLWYPSTTLVAMKSKITNRWKKLSDNQ